MLSFFYGHFHYFFVCQGTGRQALSLFAEKLEFLGFSEYNEYNSEKNKFLSSILTESTINNSLLKRLVFYDGYQGEENKKEHY